MIFYEGDKMKKNLMKMIFVLCVGLFIMGCTNTQSGGNTLGSLNRAYNNANGTTNRSMIVDTVIATTLYNHPELIPGIGVSKTKSHTKGHSKTVSNTTGGTQSFIADRGFGTSSMTNTHSITTTQTHSKSRTKSTSAGIGISPNLDFFLK